MKLKWIAFEDKPPEMGQEIYVLTAHIADPIRRVVYKGSRDRGTHSWYPVIKQKLPAIPQDHKISVGGVYVDYYKEDC